MFVRVDTYRLAAHSKGDDDRDREEIRSFAARDPINRFLDGAHACSPRILSSSIRRRIADAVTRASAAPFASLRARPARDLDGAARESVDAASATQLEAINRALFDWLSADPSVIVLGEDLRSPYGGAFKVTRGLSDEFPDRVLNTPISEAAIVGVGNGLGARRPAPDRRDHVRRLPRLVLRSSAEPRRKVPRHVQRPGHNPLVIRTPMGGGRGYGPTHSQNIEKHFVGIPG